MLDLGSLREKIDQNYRHDIVLFEAFGSSAANVCLWLPSLSYWIALASVGITSIFVSFLPSFIVYKYIIPKPKTQTSFVIGYGFLIPFYVYFPHAVVQYFDIRNKHIRSALILNAACWLFRTMEAMYGFASPGSRVSAKTYMTYFATMGIVMYDPETNKSSAPKLSVIVSRVFHFALGMIALGAYSSYLYHYNYEIFDTDAAMNSFDHSLRELFSFNHIANNFSITMLIQGYLLVFSLPMSLLANIFFRVEVKQYMKNALFDARSPSDFWGKKWNLLIHDVLKRGVYKPARLYFSANTAIIYTFLASGLFHEWIMVAILFIHENEKNDDGYCEKCYYPDMYGRNLLFFLWNGILIGIEFLALKHFPIFSRLGNALPSLLRSMMVLMTALPVAHLMFGDYVKSGLYLHAQMGLPMIVVK